MDCGTCDTSGPVQLMTPEVVNVNLTISSKAQEMLVDAFGDDRSMALLVGVLSGGCSGYMYDLQIVDETDQSCQEVTVDGFRVLSPECFKPSPRWYRDRLRRPLDGWRIQN